MNSTKYGSVEHFFIRLAEESKLHKFYFVYNSYPRSSLFVQDCKRLGIEIIIARYSNSNINHLKNSLWFYSLLKKIKPDVIQFHFGGFFNIYMRMARLLGVKKIFKIEHCCYVGRNFKPFEKFTDFSLPYRLMRKDSGGGYKQYDKIICVSKYVKRQFDMLHSSFISTNKTECLYFGVQPPKSFDSTDRMKLKEELAISSKTKVLCTTLFASKIKGLDILLKAISKIKDRDVVLIIVGINEKLETAREFHELAQSLDIEGKLRWIGITDNVQQYLSISDIYIQPSRTEALSLSVCEALSYGLPVIGSDVGGLPEVSSMTFPVGDSDMLSDKILSLLDDDSYLESLKTKAFKLYKKNLQIEESVRRYQEIYGII